ncbi:MAG TPA: hypothetical protein VK978_03880 [Candidatus Saccharimonadales bacterium]|nr:hypothetical protein [Candidatus Saccharimonadales bacterium]
MTGMAANLLTIHPEETPNGTVLHCYVSAQLVPKAMRASRSDLARTAGHPETLQFVREVFRRCPDVNCVDVDLMSISMLLQQSTRQQSDMTYDLNEVIKERLRWKNSHRILRPRPTFGK